MARLRALIALLAFGAFAAPAQAQSLQRLTVTQLTLASNQAGPQVEVPFELVVTAHVRERIAELRNLDLPVLTDVELLGDQHSLIANAQGTTYTERIRVVAHHSGTIEMAPVTLDAVDARDGKPKRYSSNPLTLTVSGGVAAMTPAVDIAGIAWALVRWLIALAAATLIVVSLVRRRSKPAEVAPETTPLPPSLPAAPQSRERRLADARIVLAADRTREAALRVRTSVREMVGANDAETLADVLRRTAADDRTMRAVLIALERAAFTHEEDFQRALDDAIARLDEAAR